MKICGSRMALAVCVLPLSAGLAAAQSDGVVLCTAIGTDPSQIGTVAGSEFAVRALEAEGINAAPIPMAFAEVPMALSVGMLDGFAFHDRDVDTSQPDMQLGVSGPALTSRMEGVSCRFIVEDAACPHVQNDQWTVSCLDGNAAQTDETTGATF
ncbi:hypothetical protein A8B78_15885 [Jannaschia sp. EhC01]|nr:hypothetical protein A8B78_15885 [Jannaschia sp. EhC01]